MHLNLDDHFYLNAHKFFINPSSNFSDKSIIINKFKFCFVQAFKALELFHLAHCLISTFFPQKVKYYDIKDMAHTCKKYCYIGMIENL